MKLHKILLIIFIGLIATSIFLVVIQFQNMQPKLSLINLDMSSVIIPSSINCTNCEKNTINEWDYSVETNEKYYIDYPLGPFSKIPENDVKVYHWINDENVIELGIIDYKIPIISQIFFKLNNPKDRLRKDFWNFSYAKKNIIPKNWNWRNTEADESIILCGDGTENNCTGWFYQARYGQYYLLIYYYQNLNYRDFEEISKAITNQFIISLNR